MNIDIRDISEDFESQINAVKENYSIATNSKAVERCVLDHLFLLEENRKLRSILRNTESEFRDYKNRIENVRTVLRGFINIP